MNRLRTRPRRIKMEETVHVVHPAQAGWMIGWSSPAGELHVKFTADVITDLVKQVPIIA